MFPQARSIAQFMARLTAMAACCLLLSLLGHAQYAGGSGRGAVQSGALPDDCAGAPGGAALPGLDCDDNDPCTIDDLWSCTCACVGTVSDDTDGDGLCDPIDPCPDLAALENGDACNDGDVCTVGDFVSGCVCAGVFQDTDGDGLCDANDPCPVLANALPGGACDDGSACTTSDIYDENCFCGGTPLPGVEGEISGNWLLADGVPYVYNALYVEGALYVWSIASNSSGWELDTSGSTVTVTAPPINAQAELCVSASQGTECLLYACMDLYVMDVGIDGISGTVADASVRPNPSDGRFELEYNRPNELVGYEVLDALGRTVRLSGTTRAAKTVIDLGNTVPGIYLLRVRHERGTDVLRLVIR